MKRAAMPRYKSAPPAGGDRCPHLEKWVVSACRAEGDRAYLPSPFQLHEYCKSRDHRKCPFYLNSLANSGALEGVACL